MTTPIRQLPRPPEYGDLREFPAIVEPRIRDLPPPDDPGIDEWEPFGSERKELPTSNELVQRLRATVFGDERLRRLLEGKRHVVIGAALRHDDKRPSAHGIVSIYNYSDDVSYEVRFDHELRLLEVVESVEQPPLAEEEIARATEIARSDERVARRLRPEYQAFVLLVSAVEHGDEHYRQRRAYVGFGPEDERMPAVRVIVDLGTKRVVGRDE
ncbi:hypothetical protein GCM10022419_131830 [Nonomuraea rosea]|uniref:Uncharacterized protein n=1 Tax=Nonomuraea rosea TaxID=638574 RepID=A0ABP7A2T0_9ACTN